MTGPTATVDAQRLIRAQVASCAAASGIWAIIVVVGGFGTQAMVAGLAQIALLAVVSVVTTVLFQPGRERYVGTLVAAWSAVSLVRFATALGGGLLLYFAARYGARPLLFSFLLAALPVLAAETRVFTGTLSSMGDNPS